ncbi:MAG: sugar-binding protein [Segetibacter sp.]
MMTSIYMLQLDITDSTVSKNFSDPENNDGVTVYIDAANVNHTQGLIRASLVFFLSADNKVIVKEGKSGNWVTKSANAVKHAAISGPPGYVQELAIPWNLLGGKPRVNTRIGYNMSLTENTGKSSPELYRNHFFKP